VGEAPQREWEEETIAGAPCRVRRAVRAAWCASLRGWLLSETAPGSTSAPHGPDGIRADGEPLLDGLPLNADG